MGRLWLNHGYEMVDGGVQIRRQTPINFYETGPKWSIKHAEAIEKEGVLDQSAQDAWMSASADWQELGERSISTTAPFTIKLGRLDDLLRQRADKAERFRQLTAEGFDEAIAKSGTLTPIVQEAFQTPPEARTESQKSMVSESLKTSPTITTRSPVPLPRKSFGSDPVGRRAGRHERAVDQNDRLPQPDQLRVLANARRRGARRSGRTGSPIDVPGRGGQPRRGAAKGDRVVRAVVRRLGGDL